MGLEKIKHSNIANRVLKNVKENKISVNDLTPLANGFSELTKGTREENLEKFNQNYNKNKSNDITK